MKHQKINYNSLSNVSKNQFNSLFSELFPHLNIIKINKFGTVFLKEKGFSIFKKRNRKSILDLLFTSLPVAIAIKFWGNDKIATHYRKKIKRELEGNSSESESIERIISLLYNECFIKEYTKSVNKETLDDSNHSESKKEIAEVIDNRSTISYLDVLDYLFNGLRRKNQHSMSLKNYLKAISVKTNIAVILINNWLEDLLFQKENKVLKNLCMRDPPIHNIILYNSS